jgi:hypothetical protein
MKSYRTKGQTRGPFEFELDDEKFSCSGGVSLLDLSELVAFAEEEMTSPAGMAALAEFFKNTMEPADYARLKRVLRKTDPDDDALGEIMVDLVEHYTKGPTPPPSPAGDGRQTQSTRYTSEVDLPRPDIPEFTEEQVQKIRQMLATGQASTQPPV